MAKRIMWTIALVLAVTTALFAQGGVSPSGPWNAFTADITIRRYEVKSDGTPSGTPAPRVTYRWERVQAPTGWRTTMTLVAGERPTVQSLRGPVDINPYSVLRVEDDGDGSPVRVIGANGRQVPALPPQLLAAAADRTRKDHPQLAEAKSRGWGAPYVAGREWVDAFIATADKAERRRTALVFQYGRAVRREANGLDRHVSMAGHDRRDVLVDPATAVPVSVSVSRGGVLRALTNFSYVPGPGTVLVRQAIESQHVIADDRRAVTRIDYTNVRLEQRRTPR